LGREERIGNDKVRGKRTGREKRSGKGKETLKGKVLLNKPPGELIFFVPLLCSGRRKCHRQTWIRRAN
jgi:hypothetical protein